MYANEGKSIWIDRLWRAFRMPVMPELQPSPQFPQHIDIVGIVWVQWVQTMLNALSSIPREDQMGWHLYCEDIAAKGHMQTTQFKRSLMHAKCLLVTKVQTLHGFDMRSAAEKQAASNQATVWETQTNTEWVWVSALWRAILRYYMIHIIYYLRLKILAYCKFNVMLAWMASINMSPPTQQGSKGEWMLLSSNCWWSRPQ